MDSSSSSSSVGFPLPGNSESAESSITLHSSSSAVGIHPSENSQSTENPPNQQITCNGPPTITVSDAEWNVELAKSFHDFNFCFFMAEGDCKIPFIEWYRCMHRVIYAGGDRADCSRLAGILRNCVNSNRDYYQPILTRFPG